MADTVVYLYALVRPGVVPDLSPLRGVSGTAVRLVRDDRLACLVSDVDEDEFGETALRTNLEDLRWLERAAREHDAVVAAAAREMCTAPLRFATVCRDDASVRARLHVLGPQAAAVLDRIDGCDEWGVKLYADPSSPVPVPAGGSVVDEHGATGSGTAYLMQRRRELADRAFAVEQDARAADEVFAVLAESAVAARRHRLQDPQLSGDQRPMLLNGAFLVRRGDADSFRALVHAVAYGRRSIAAVLTGPWAPYSFASTEQDP